MPWLRKTADVVEVVENMPDDSMSGTCPLCATMDGEPVDEVGNPPFHPRCKCRSKSVQRKTQPEDILSEEFQMTPADSVEPEYDPGGVTELF